MLICGLLGKKLSHSYSPEIHKMLGEYEYNLYEKDEKDIEAFLKETSFNGINVTIPYKKTVVPYLNSISEEAKEIGSVNTIIRKQSGELYGYNTDIYGFIELVNHSGIDVKNKKTLVLGSGGAGAAVCAALKKLKADIVVISRTGENDYDNIDRHSDAQIIVNATPLGMYPETGKSPIDLRKFPKCVGVLDLIYNPSKTSLLLQAEELGIPGENGLYMLVAQAKRSAELFTGEDIPKLQTDKIVKSLSASMQNIVLIGMPGSGKSTLAEKIGKLTGRKVLDSDIEIERKTGETPSNIITQKGEQAFRDIESDVIADLGKQSHSVIATGGGVVIREENYRSLHQNGIIVWIRRDLSGLALEDRPLSQKSSIEELYAIREPLYRKFADIIVDINEDEETSANMVLSAINKTSEV